MPEVTKKKAAIRISDNVPLENAIFAYLQSIDVEPQHIAEKNTLEQMLARKEVVDLVITNDQAYIAANARLDSTLPFLYVGQTQVPEYPKNVTYAVDFFQAVALIPKALRARDEERVTIVRTMGERDVAESRTLLLRSRLIRLEKGGLTNVERERLERESIEFGGSLANMLSTSTGKLAIKAGQSAHHEGSGWRVVDTFVKLVYGIPEVPGGKSWTAKENAMQRYTDGRHFEKTSAGQFPIAHIYYPIHFSDYSLTMYDFADGPTLSQVLQELRLAFRKATDRPKTKERQRRLRTYNAITMGLTERQMKYLAFWVTNAPSVSQKHQQSGDEVRAYYTHSLQKTFDKILTQIPPNSFSDEDRTLWNGAVRDVMDILRYDQEFITRYRDLTSRNVVIARQVYTIENILREFIREPHVEKGKVIITRSTELIDRITNVEKTLDLDTINIDTNVRGMHILEDFYHLIVEPEVYCIVSKPGKKGHASCEDELLSAYLKSISSRQFETSSFKPTERATMGFYRSARKIGNLVDFGANVHHEFERGFIVRDMYKRRLRQFGEDVGHYIASAKTFLDRLMREKCKESPNSAHVTKLIANLGINFESSRVVIPAEYSAELGHLTDSASRVAYQAGLVNLYLEILKRAFHELHYNGSRK